MADQQKSRAPRRSGRGAHRRRLYDPVTGTQPHSPSTTVLSEALGASLDARKGNRARMEAAAASRTFEDVAVEWWPRFKTGRAGHADPRTTRRYDRARHELDGHATYTLAAFLPAPPLATGAVNVPD